MHYALPRAREGSILGSHIANRAFPARSDQKDFSTYENVRALERGETHR